MNNITLFFAALAVWNLITFILMGIDKNKSIKHNPRISEKSLFLCSFLFGAFGVFCGMFVFRHKTKHWSFRIFIPLAAVVNIIAIYFLYQNIA